MLRPPNDIKKVMRVAFILIESDKHEISLRPLVISKNEVIRALLKIFMLSFEERRLVIKDENKIMPKTINKLFMPFTIAFDKVLTNPSCTIGISLLLLLV